MSTSERLDYLSQAYQFASEAPAKKRDLPNQVFDQVIVPTYQAILKKDGVYLAAAVFAVAYADTTPRTGYNYGWARDVKTRALADPDLAPPLAGRQFAPFALHPNFTWASLEERLSKSLFIEAQKGDPNACGWLSTSARVPDEVSSACARVGGSGQSRFQAVVDDQQRQQAAREEAKRRRDAAKPIDVQVALEVQRRCAEVGVASPVIDPGKVDTLVSQ